MKHLRFQEGKIANQIVDTFSGVSRCLQRKQYTGPALPIKKQFQIHCSTCSSSFACILYAAAHKKRWERVFLFIRASACPWRDEDIRLTQPAA